MTKAEIQLVRSLCDKRERTQRGVFVAEGEKLVREFAESNFKVEHIYFTSGDFPGVNSEKITPKEMERISHLKTPTNCLALVGIPDLKLDTGSFKGKLTLALDEVQNPGNMGTIIRLADWFGIRNVICCENSADCFNPKVVQATMGAITRVGVYYGSLATMLSDAASEGIPIFGTFLEGESIYDAELSSEGILVLGNEGNGISVEIERFVTRKLFIPPYPAERIGSESLNVAMAAAIACSEFRRR